MHLQEHIVNYTLQVLTIKQEIAYQLIIHICVKLCNTIVKYIDLLTSVDFTTPCYMYVE